MPIQTFHDAGDGPAAAVRLLDDMKRLSVERLSAVPGGLYEPIENQLNEALRLGTSLTPRNDLKTVLAMRQRNAIYVTRYRELIEQGFADFRVRAVSARSGLPLGLVNESELEFHLAGQRLAESIANRYQKPLELLDRRLEALSEALGMQAGLNPVGPVQLTGVFLQTYREANISQSLQPLMFRYYDQELSKVLGELYQRLNSRLAIHGFLADGRRPGSEPSRQAPAPEAPAAVTVNAAASDAETQQLRQLREMMHRWRAANDDGATNARRVQAAPGGPRLRAAELTSVATLMQRDAQPGLARAMSDGGSLRLALRDCLLEGTRRFGLDPDMTPLGEEEEDAIDLVGLLFESLVRNEGLADEGRRLLARLMLPYTRIALGDMKLFMRPDHPARRFVDAVTLSCEDCDAESPQDAELMQRAATAVDHVVAGYNEDLAIFELATQELQDLLEQHRRRAEVVERRSVETVHGRERLLQARLQAGSALARQASGVPLSAIVFDFLEQQWSHHLVQVILRDGFGSERHAQALALGEELVAVDRAAAQCARGEVVTRVVAIRAQLVDCLSSTGLDADGANEWMAGLARALAFPDAPRSSRTLSATPRLADDSDDTRLLKVVAGNAALDFDAAVAERMRALESGTWLRLVDEAGNESGVKIAWISPLTSRLLLVNRRGIRKLVASPEELAALSKLGRLSTEADHMPFDEALRQVRHQLADTAVAA